MVTTKLLLPSQTSVFFLALQPPPRFANMQCLELPSGAFLETVLACDIIKVVNNLIEDTSFNFKMVKTKNMICFSV